MTAPSSHPANRFPLLTLAALAATTLAFDAAQAAESAGSKPEVATTSDNDASERISLAGDLRMLSQRVVSASCFLQAGIETDSSRAVLRSATTAFAQIIAALEFGDPDLGVTGPEDRRRTLAGLAKLGELWAPIASLAQTVDAGAGTTDDVAAIAEQSVALRDVTDRLIVQITSQYATQTTVLQSDALRLDLASRQRTLAQEIAKDGCLMSRSIAVETSADELGTHVDNFTTSLDALRFGLQEVGILPPPTTEIEDSLSGVARNWSFMSGIVTDLASGSPVDDVTLGVMFLMSNQVTDNLENVVGLYVDASKLGL